MNFDEIAMCAGEPGERIQRLHHARAPRPTAPYSAGKRYHGDTSIAERRESGVHVSIARAAPDVILLHIANIGARGKPVLRQPDSPVAQVGAYLLVLHTIEAEVLECLREGSKNPRTAASASVVRLLVLPWVGFALIALAAVLG